MSPVKSYKVKVKRIYTIYPSNTVTVKHENTENCFGILNIPNFVPSPFLWTKRGKQLVHC